MFDLGFRILIEWLDARLNRKKKWSVKKTWKLGQQGKPIDRSRYHCLTCGKMRKDHRGQDHRFRGLEEG